MSTAQSILILGGLFQLLLMTLAGYFIYWRRVGGPDEPAPRYAITSHKVTMWNGFLLLGLAVAIDHTGFTDQVNILLAAAQVAGTLGSAFSNAHRWYVGMRDQFIEGPERRVRLIAVAHIVELLVIPAIMVGVARTAFGLW
jgi:hypothetical protein